MPIRITPVVKILLIACFAGFIVQQSADQFLGGHLLSWFGLIPAEFVLHFKFWQVITYSFLHADVTHLVLNLMMLAFIGGEIEARWGMWKFVRYYFACVVAAGFFYVFLQFVVWGQEGLAQPMVGASGGIYGLLMAYGLMFAERQLLFMMLFPMKAKHFVWILVGVEFMTTLFSGRGGLGSAAHLGGMFAGFGYLWFRAYYQRAQRQWTEQKQMRNAQKTADKRSDRVRQAGKQGKLKLVVDNQEFDPDKPDNGDKPPKTWH